MSLINNTFSLQLLNHITDTPISSEKTDTNGISHWLSRSFNTKLSDGLNCACVERGESLNCSGTSVPNTLVDEVRPHAERSQEDAEHWTVMTNVYPQRFTWKRHYEAHQE